MPLAVIRAWKGSVLLTEQEVSRSFRRLFANTEVDEETFVKAESLLDELRLESPLRHRLSVELDELRRMHGFGQPA